MESMDEIYRRYAVTVYQYLLSLTHSEEIAEDVMQETFCQAIRSIDRYDGSCRITTWLCAIAKRQLLTYRRKHPQAEPLERRTEDGDEIAVLDEQAQSPSAESEFLAESGKAQLLRQIHHLPEPGREVLYLRIFGGLSFREIGEVFDKTENWARVTFYRSKDRLRREMDD